MVLPDHASFWLLFQTPLQQFLIYLYPFMSVFYLIDEFVLVRGQACSLFFDFYFLFIDQSEHFNCFSFEGL